MTIDENLITFQPSSSSSRVEVVRFYYALEFIGNEITWYRGPDGRSTWFGNFFAEQKHKYEIMAGLRDEMTAMIYMQRAGVVGKTFPEPYGDRLGIYFEDVMDAVKFYLVNRETMLGTPDQEACWTEEHKAFLASDEEPECVASHRRRIQSNISKLI